MADILPTGYEVGVLNGHVGPGDVVAVVGAGPIGLAAIMGARLFLQVQGFDINPALLTPEQADCLQTETDADQGEQHASTEHDAKHVTALRAKSHAHTKFFRSLRHGVGDDAVDPDCRENQRRARKQREQ